MSELRFDRAEFAGAQTGAVVCTACQQSIVQSYYTINDKVVCSTCRELRERATDGSGGGRMVKAIFAGLGVGVLGAALWWVVRYLTNYEIGLISVAVGIGVGKAVRWGSGNRGGLAYQIAAVLITYASICGNYVPDIVQAAIKNAKEDTAITTSAKPATPSKTAPSKDAPSFTSFLAAIAVLLGYAMAMPFLMGFQNIIGLLIIAFGLWEAWKINRKRPEVIAGPYSVTPTSTPAPNV